MERELKKESIMGGFIDHNCGAKDSKSLKRVNIDIKSRGRIYLVKKCIIMMLILTMIFCGIVSFANTETVKFRDINANHWAVSFIESLRTSNIVAGYPDGTFRPGANVKINEFIAMTVKALGFYYESPVNDWAKPYIDKALELNIIEVGQFTNYNEPITRQSMTSVTLNAVVLSEERPSTEFDENIAYEIKDYTTICDYCKQNVLDAYKLGITTGYSDKTFRPWLSSTRAEATTLISKIINPDLRDVPSYDFKTTIKHWYWVKENGDHVNAETNIYKNGEFKLVDVDFYMPVYKGKNVREMYELGKYMSTLAAEAGDSPFHVFSKGPDGFGIYGFKDKTVYTSIFEQNIQRADQVMQIPARFEIILGANAYLYPEYSYMISLDKVLYEKYRGLIEKMIRFQFKQDAGNVLEKVNIAVATNDYELIKFGIAGRNVKISNTPDQIMIEYSVKYN
jgi:hypothetical protein